MAEYVNRKTLESIILDISPETKILFDNVPDIVSIVRCKDCRYRGMIFCPAVHETMGNGLVDYTSDEAYCWRGRPREGANAT